MLVEGRREQGVNFEQVHWWLLLYDARKVEGKQYHSRYKNTSEEAQVNQEENT